MAKSNKKMTKKQQERKRKSRTLILLLFLTIIMFGTSTYAWFTANRVVTINSLDVHVEASNGLQISTDASTWKSVITNADITTNAYTGNVNQVPSDVTAVSTDGVVNTTTGRLNMYGAVIDNDATTGDYTITAALETDAAGSTGKYIAFDVFLRVDTSRPIYLTTESNVSNTDATDKGLKNSARVGFVMLGNAASDSSTSTLIGLNNAAASAIIWEPNTDTHTSIVTNSVAPEYGIDVSGASTTYYGINKAIPTAQNLKQVVAGSTSYTTQVTPTIKTVAGFDTYQTAFTLQAGVTKVRIYMWIEGQDIDCENNATGSNIQFNVQLSTESSASGSSSSSSGA